MAMEMGAKMTQPKICHHHRLASYCFECANNFCETVIENQAAGLEPTIKAQCEHCKATGLEPPFESRVERGLCSECKGLGYYLCKPFSGLKVEPEAKTVYQPWGKGKKIAYSAFLKGKRPK